MTFELYRRAAAAATFASAMYEDVDVSTGPTMITTLAVDRLAAEAAGTASPRPIRNARERALRSLRKGSLRASADRLVVAPANRMWRASPDSRMGSPDSMPTSSRPRMGRSSEVLVGTARSGGVRWGLWWSPALPGRWSR